MRINIQAEIEILPSNQSETLGLVSALAPLLGTWLGAFGKPDAKAKAPDPQPDPTDPSKPYVRL